MKKLDSARQSRTGMRALSAAVLLAATALSGCYGDHAAVVDNYPEDIRTRHPIAIHEGRRTLELFVGVSRGGLTPQQAADVAAFAHNWRREASGGLLIDVPHGTPNERAAADAAAEVRSLLAASGVDPSVIASRPYRPVTPVKLATLRLTYPTMVAEAGPCGLWPRDLGATRDGDDASNHSYWNFGCTQQRNLAAMVDTPSDLVQPRGETPAYTARRTFMLNNYRQGLPTGTQATETEKGKISEIGSGGGK